ncbi:MAG: MATE family efflux transporter [Bryobacteraceae bacterium]
MSARRKEWRATLALALPLIVAELGWIAMGLEDTMFIGRLNGEWIGAVGIGTNVYHTIAGMAGGLLLGLDTLVSQAFGAGDRRDCRRSLIDGVWFAALLIPLVMVATWAVQPLLAVAGVRTDVLAIAHPYMKVLNLGAPPLLIFFALRRYLQSVGVVRPIMFTLLVANLVNIAGNWIFVFGNLGAPALGAVGSGYATLLSRLFMVVSLGVITYRREQELLNEDWRPSPRIRKLLSLGIPAAGQMVLEYSVWTATTVLAGRFATEVLAGHQIALMTVTTTFMMPLGVSSAAAVRVGQAVGRPDASGAARAGWTAVALGAIIMSASALTLLLFPDWIARIFTPDPKVIAAAVPILRMAALFQLFDGFQVVTTGALRGVGDTRTPMLCHFLGYWVLGFPLGLWLGFGRSMQAMGIWAGLSLGLIFVGSVLLAAWYRAARVKIPALCSSTP